MPLQAYMADAIDPYDIPNRFRRNPNGVLVYRDGPYDWSEEAVSDFPNHWGITVTGNPALAHDARVIDVERYDATPADVPAFAAARAQLGAATIVYCSRDTVPLVTEADSDWSRLEWFIATLDDVAWTAAGLSQWIMDDSGVYVSPAKIRACQNVPGDNYDRSLIYGAAHWAHPGH
jgi:hypothetical protein